ncbi:Mss4-like protein [Wallemia mellicola]|uniref:Mss4-like protein n=1 Tax=Wallemia mellicola TaxID=1708541 RepID=A0A4V4MNM4_9BASI|nr:Mss4-like protein [Wallemia mellicola]TIC05463.1 Mss4-like protein [Wallemia mellicola]TIC11734.1 Mss4-like protein [Wallemia mellicola]TIC23488.1 Mss4-like protein [Wallemia mellicola]TIC35601.1 Mss4-like protein [Wallemia mellicola]
MFDESYIIDKLEHQELSSAASINNSSYTATDIDKLEYRYKYAGDLFLGIFHQPRTQGLIGFVTSTLTNEDTFSEQSAKEHDPSGHTVLIHSLTVHNEDAHRETATTKLFTEYMRRLDESSYNRVLIISSKEQVPFFEKYQFEITKEIDNDQVEMSHDITPQKKPSITQADILAALSKPSTKPNLNLLTFTDQSKYEDFLKDSKNSRNARCPRVECKSLVFLSGAADLKSLETIHPLSILPPDNQFSHPSLPEPHLDKAWRLAGPMSFENITFSKTAPQTAANVSKFLACGECEIGSLGWVDNAGCWIDVKRVLYE